MMVPVKILPISFQKISGRLKGNFRLPSLNIAGRNASTSLFQEHVPGASSAKSANRNQKNMDLLPADERKLADLLYIPARKALRLNNL